MYYEEIREQKMSMCVISRDFCVEMTMMQWLEFVATLEEPAQVISVLSTSGHFSEESALTSGCAFFELWM